MGAEKLVSVNPLSFLKSSRSFLSHTKVGRLRIAYYRKGPKGGLLAKAWFGPGTEGPPGHAHGGSISAALDEAMGAAVWMQGYAVMTLRLTTWFRRPLPLKTEASIEPEITGTDVKRVYTKASLIGPEGRIFAEAEAVFMRLPAEKLENLFHLRIKTGA